MAQVLIPPDDARVGATPIRTILAPSGLYVPSSDAGAEQQVVTQAGPDGALATVAPYGYARVANEPETLFTEPFDGAIDTLDRWTTGGTVAPTVTGGYGTVSPGVVTASASSSLVSKMVIGPQGLNFRTVGCVARFENMGAAAGLGFATNAHRFIGMATVPGTWQALVGAVGAAGPILDGIGFEIATDGLMYPVIYTGGVRMVASVTGGAASLNAARTLANGAHHQFAITFRADAMFWYVDGQNQPAAVMSYAAAGFGLPNNQTLPIRIHSINSTVAASNVPILQVASIALADTGDNQIQISDAVLPYRKARVTDPAAITNALLYGAGAQTNGAALNVNSNAVQVATYKAAAKPAAAALVAGTFSYRVALHHAATSTKTVKIRKVEVNAMMTAVAEGSVIEVHKISTAPTGTAITGVGSAAAGSLIPMHPADPAAEAILTNSVTAAGTFAGIVASGFLAAGGATAHGGGVIVYAWPEGGVNKPITLRAGVLEGIAIGIVSNAAVTPTLLIEVTFTEE